MLHLCLELILRFSNTTRNKHIILLSTLSYYHFHVPRKIITTVTFILSYLEDSTYHDPTRKGIFVPNGLVGTLELRPMLSRSQNPYTCSYSLIFTPLRILSQATNEEVVFLSVKELTPYRRSSSSRFYFPPQGARTSNEIFPSSEVAPRSPRSSRSYTLPRETPLRCSFPSSKHLVRDESPVSILEADDDRALALYFRVPLKPMILGKCREPYLLKVWYLSRGSSR